MPFRLDRFLAVVESLTNKRVAHKISKACDAREKQATTPHQKAKLVKSLIDQLDKTVSKKYTFLTMETCGRMCIGQTTIKSAKKLREQSKDLDHFLVLLNKAGIGGGHLTRKRRQIHGTYDRCYCGWVSKTKEPISLTYCHCSAGWYKELFEKTLEMPVSVAVVQSIISGAKSCRFIIELPE